MEKNKSIHNFDKILDYAKPKPLLQSESESQDYTSQEQSEDTMLIDETTSIELHKQEWRSPDCDEHINIPRQVYEVFARINHNWDTEIEFAKKLNDISTKAQSYSDNLASINQVQLHDWYKNFLSIHQNSWKKMNKNEQEENSKAVDFDIKFTKDIIVSDDG